MASNPNMCVAQPPAPTGEQPPILVEIGKDVAGKAGGLAQKAFPAAEKLHSAAGNTLDLAAKPVAAANAFRRYSWLSFDPVKNRSGNLRGMVINKKAHTVFKVVDKWGNRLAVAGILIEVAKEYDRIEAVVRSDADAAEKWQRSLLLGSAAILRSVTSIVPAAFSAASTAGQGYAMLYSEITGNQAGYDFAKDLKQWDKKVTAIHRRQWDGETWYDVIEWVLE